MYSLVKGLAAAARAFNVSKQLAQYWRTKLIDPTFHNGSHGGIRQVFFFSLSTSKFTHIQKLLLPQEKKVF
jgi:hypothetical protein